MITIAKEYTKRKLLMFIGGYITLTLGSLHVNAYNIWGGEV